MIIDKIIFAAEIENSKKAAIKLNAILQAQSMLDDLRFCKSNVEKEQQKQLINNYTESVLTLF